MGIGCNVKMNMGKLARNGKAWIFVIGISGVTLFKVFGFAELPKRVDAVEQEDVGQNKAIDKLANSVDKYIAVQQAKEEADVKKEELLFKWIEAVSKK